MKTKRDSDLAEVALLERLFPDIDPVDSSDHQRWLEDFAGKVRTRLDAAEARVAELEDKEDMGEEVRDLEKQVQHYKNVLAQTVRS